MKIKENILKILDAGEIKGNLYYLPAQLDRKSYVSANEILVQCGAKWSNGKKAHEFKDDSFEEKFNDALLTGEYTDVKKEFQFFPTPVEIAQQMVEMANLEEDDIVLESSAGLGRIADEISKVTKNIVLFELNPESCKVLKDKGYDKVFNEDFIAAQCSLTFDKCIINPPFRGGQDILHIEHSFGMLREGGILISICSESVFFREQAKFKAFRENILDKYMVENIKLDSGAFKESGTMVNTRIIKLVKN